MPRTIQSGKMILKVEIFAGASIEDAINEVSEIAYTLDCTAEFDFNGVRIVCDGASPLSQHHKIKAEAFAQWAEAMRARGLLNG